MTKLSARIQAHSFYVRGIKLEWPFFQKQLSLEIKQALLMLIASSFAYREM